VSILLLFSQAPLLLAFSCVWASPLPPLIWLGAIHSPSPAPGFFPIEPILPGSESSRRRPLMFPRFFLSSVFTPPNLVLPPPHLAFFGPPLLRAPFLLFTAFYPPPSHLPLYLQNLFLFLPSFKFFCFLFLTFRQVRRSVPVRPSQSPGEVVSFGVF